MSWVLLRGAVLESKDAELPDIRTPLSIYVLWHPAFTAGRELAREVYRWFGDASDDVRRVGLGIPVHFRSKDWPDALELVEVDPPASTDAERPFDPFKRAKYDAERRVRRPIHLDSTQHNVLVPLVDDHMVSDPSWRRDLLEMVRARAVLLDHPKSTLHLIAVQVSDALTRLPELFSSIQPIRLDRWDDSKVDVERIAETRRARFCRLLTQALVRRLRVNVGGGGSGLPHQVFVSHAKRDGNHGPGIAEQIRSTAAGYGQIDVFYDENALAPGEPWRQQMLGSAAGGGAFIAVQSDSYSSRYWCRREVQAARTPQLVARQGGESPLPDGRTVAIWRVQPSVVIAAFDGRWSRLLPDLGSAPAVRWVGEHTAGEVLDGLFKEAILAEVQVLYARQLQDLWREQKREGSAEHLHVITWTPDAWTLLRLQGIALARKEWQGEVVVVYPGHGFLPTEEEMVRSSFGPGVTFRAFEAFGEELLHGPPKAVPEGAPSARSPAFSLAAGDPADLAELGYDDEAGSVHLTAATLRLAMALFRAGARIVSAGQLRQGEGFLDMLIDAADASFPDGAGGTTEVSPITPLESLVVWPTRMSPQVRAQEHGRTTFVDVPPPGWTWAELGMGPGDLPEHDAAWAGAAALSRARRRLAATSHAMILLGGKAEGWSGVMPGLAEELLCACEEAVGWGGDLPDALEPAAHEDHRQACEALRHMSGDTVRVLILGAFGGTARALVRVLVRPDFVMPDSCVLRLARAHPKNDKLKRIWQGRSDLQRRWIVQRYERLEHALRGLHRVTVAGEPLSRLGLEMDAWKSLMVTDSVGEMRRLLQGKVAPALRLGT